MSNKDKARYVATDADLPKELWPAEVTNTDPSRPTLFHARLEVERQLHELGLNVTEQETTLCTLVLYCYWEDERQNLGEKSDGDGGKANS
jgi:hypothetical protein